MMLFLLVAALALGVVAGWMPGQAPRSEEPQPQPPPPPPAPHRLTEVEAAWQKLQARLERPEGDAALLRRDLVAFRARFPRAPESKRVTAALLELPSPLDHLAAPKVSAKERLAWQPKELVGVLGDRKAGAAATVQCLAFSPDGQQVARGTADGTVRLWDTATLKAGPVLAGHQGAVAALAFAPDGKTLATAGRDGAVHVWDASTGKLLSSLREHKQAVIELAFHPEGKGLVSLGKDGVLKLWITGAAKAAGMLEGRKDVLPVCVAFSPGGRTLACGQADGKVRLVALEKNQVITTHTVQTGPVRVLAFSPAGRLLLTGGADGR